MTERIAVRLMWGRGLCRHGCGEPVRSPRNRFVNGHDGKLMHTLLLAHLTGSPIRVAPPTPGTMVVEEFSAREWAERAFSAAGLRHFDDLVSRYG